MTPVVILRANGVLSKGSFDEESPRYLIEQSFSQSYSNKDLCVLVASNKEERGQHLGYSFEYLGLLLELFPVLSRSVGFYGFELGKGQSNAQKVKLDVRQDDFLSQNELVDLSEIGKSLHTRISSWDDKYTGMFSKEGKSRGAHGAKSTAIIAYLLDSTVECAHLGEIWPITEDKAEDRDNQDIDRALEQYPEMTEKKKVNELHGKLIKNIMEQVKLRGLESCVVFSEEILKKGKLRWPLNKQGVPGRTDRFLRE